MIFGSGVSWIARAINSGSARRLRAGLKITNDMETRVCAGSRDFPSAAILLLNKRVGFRSVPGLQVGTVPFDFLAGAQGHISAENDLGQSRAIFKITAGRFSAFAGCQPV